MPSVWKTKFRQLAKHLVPKAAEAATEPFHQILSGQRKNMLCKFTGLSGSRPVNSKAVVFEQLRTTRLGTNSPLVQFQSLLQRQDQSSNAVYCNTQLHLGLGALASNEAAPRLSCLDHSFFCSKLLSYLHAYLMQATLLILGAF